MTEKENLGQMSTPLRCVRLTFHVSRFATYVLRFTFYAIPFVSAAAVDESKLPPAANTKIEFDQDIKPILENTCWRCHGPEKPRSHFRLDNRESALKGGDNGTDIIPGDSAKSPLVHYVARLVPDMEMPPPGKGEPLTSEQVGLLRAWIDQGAAWGATNPPVQLAFSVSPTLRWTTIEGDKAKFREVEGIKEGYAGGIEEFSLQEQISPDEKFTAEGRALFGDHDYKLHLALEKGTLGFVRGGYEQWRRYYDDTGGYYQPFTPSSFDLNRDLYLDLGRAWIDFGLTLPNWPQIVLGYEYQFKEGAKFMLEWGNVGGVANPNARNIYPAAKDIHERVHIAKLDLAYDFEGFHLEDKARVEIYSLHTLQDDYLSFTAGLGPGPDYFARTIEGATHVQGMNTMHLERQMTDEWLMTAGYLYSKFQGDASFDQVTLDSTGVPASGNFWSSDGLLLKREANVFSLGSLVLPANGLSVSVGVQAEWDRQEGAGRVSLDEWDFSSLSFPASPETLTSHLDTAKTMENVGLRFTSIPYTVMFTEARFEQANVSEFEQNSSDIQPPSETQPDSFTRDTEATNTRRDGRIGFNTSPWRWLTFSAQYKDRLSDTDYDKFQDFRFVDPMTGFPTPSPGYPEFIRRRKIDGDEVEAKLVLRPAHWLKTTFTYQLARTHYSTVTDPVLGPDGATFVPVPDGLLAGRYEAHVYGVNLTLTPFQRFYFSGTFTYTDSRTATAVNDEPSVVPYKGKSYAVIASANYTVNKSTDLQASYSFSESDYGQDNVADGLPLGLNYTRHGVVAGVKRRLASRLTASLRYGFYRYLEPSSGGLNDYTAHGVFATLMVKWP